MSGNARLDGTHILPRPLSTRKLELRSRTSHSQIEPTQLLLLPCQQPTNTFTQNEDNGGEECQKKTKQVKRENQPSLGSIQKFSSSLLLRIYCIERTPDYRNITILS